MNRPPAWWSFLPSIVNLYINEPINYNASGRYIYIFHDYSIFYFVYNRIFSDGSTLYRKEGGSQQGERYVTIIMSHNFYIKIVKMWQILLTDWLTDWQRYDTKERERGGTGPPAAAKTSSCHETTTVLGMALTPLCVLYIWAISSFKSCASFSSYFIILGFVHTYSSFIYSFLI